MACDKIAEYRELLSNNISDKLNAYSYQLQTRYGDPRVYAAQVEQMRRQNEHVAHWQDRQNAKLLHDAYARQQARHEMQHSERMLKRRGASSRPRSAKAPAQTKGRTQPPPEPRPPAAAGDAASPFSE